MSYESRVFSELSFPSRDEVIRVLLPLLLKHKGRVKEFGSGDQEFADDIADEFNLSAKQRTFELETIVQKDSRLKKSPAWNRLLFRAADLAAKQGLLARPTSTLRLTGRREWMLTERGIDEALQLARVPIGEKDKIPVVTFEVQKFQSKLEKAEPPKNYNPIDTTKKVKAVSSESLLRNRGFRLAVLGAYDYRCSVCGLKISSPDSLTWEVEAAHIVPHRFYGRDDIWNGISLCRFHHWCFDVGWFTLRLDFTIELSSSFESVSAELGYMGSLDVFRGSLIDKQKIALPKRKSIFPHGNSISWHRENVFGHKV